MKIYRRTDEALQSLRLELAADGKASFTIFPTIHLADRAFFEPVKSEADQHDAVLKEGIYGQPGKFAHRMVRLASSNANGLTAQTEVVKADQDHWYHGDIDPDDFKRTWLEIPLWRRLLIAACTPLVGLVLRSRRARIWLSETFVDSDMDAERSMEWIGGVEFRKAVLDDRDAALAVHCESMMDGWNGCRIAVVWGGGHVPQLVDFLRKKHGYRIENSEWMTMIDLR